MEKSFAFIGHPPGVRNLDRNLRLRKPEWQGVNPELLTKVFEWTPAFVSEELIDVPSATGASRSGVVIMATMLPEMVSLTPLQGLQKTIEACQLAEREGARLSTLGGHTSIAGSIASAQVLGSVPHPVTTGNTFTVAMAVHQVVDIAESVGLDLSNLDLCVLGGTGDIGSACAELLAPRFRRVTITARNRQHLARLIEQVKERQGVTIQASDDNRTAVREADVVIAATSAARAILDPGDFKPGALVSDIGYPKNIRQMADRREDVLVYLGGLCQTPAPIVFAFDIDLPRDDLLYGCFGEGLILDFEERYCCFSQGRGNITPDDVTWMLEAGRRHGYVPAPPCQYGEFLGAEEIRAILAHNPKLA